MGLVETLRITFRHSQFRPGILGFFLNPFYVIRRELYRAILPEATRSRGRILDFGCGSKPYRELFSGVAEYIGIDVAHSAHNKSKIDVVFDGKHIPFPDESFDGVVSFEVLEHVFEPGEVLREIHRVLKPSGRLLLTVPLTWDEHEIPYDYGRYTSYGLKHLITRAGFEIVSLQKTGTALLTIVQLTSAYIYQLFPRNRVARVVLTPLFIAPLHAIGYLVNFALPKKSELYLSNVVIAMKSATTPKGPA